jgi:hypothetical protein
MGKTNFPLYGVLDIQNLVSAEYLHTPNNLTEKTINLEHAPLHVPQDTVRTLTGFNVGAT